MIQIRFQLHGDLAGLVRGATCENMSGTAQGTIGVQRDLREIPSVKDALERVGIPHTEVDRLVCAGRPLEWKDPLPAEGWVDVWPVPAAGSESSLQIGLLLRSDDSDTQLAQVLRRFVVSPESLQSEKWFGRCSKCNGNLEKKTLVQVADRIPPRTASWIDTYYLCRDCDQLFWEGTHVASLRRRLHRIIQKVVADLGGITDL